jgi:hypothetical protein
MSLGDWTAYLFHESLGNGFESSAQDGEVFSKHTHYGRIDVTEVTHLQRMNGRYKQGTMLQDTCMYPG